MQYMKCAVHWGGHHIYVCDDVTSPPTPGTGLGFFPQTYRYNGGNNMVGLTTPERDEENYKLSSFGGLMNGIIWPF